jgi:hypothetical protein
MSDYLTNLAARALAPVPTIVPRQGSLFEPVAARSGPSAVARPADDWEGGRGESVEVEPHPTAARSRVFPARPRPPAESPVEASAPLPVTGIPRPPTLPAHPREVSAVVSPVAQVTKIESIAAAPPAESSAAPAPTPRLWPVATDRPQSGHEPAESPREEPFLKEPRRGLQRKVEASNAAEDRGENARQSPRPVAPAREPFAPTVVATSPQRPEPATAAPSHQSAGPPTIRITIGRVEVRAVAPPAAAVATPRIAGRPRMSLEDYLKERSGGRR